MEPRKEQNDILENDMQLRGGPKQLNQLSTNMVFESEEYLVLNKQYDTRLDGQFACTIEKAVYISTLKGIILLMFSFEETFQVWINSDGFINWTLVSIRIMRLKVLIQYV